MEGLEDPSEAPSLTSLEKDCAYNLMRQISKFSLCLLDCDLDMGGKFLFYLNEFGSFVEYKASQCNLATTNLVMTSTTCFHNLK